MDDTEHFAGYQTRQSDRGEYGERGRRMPYTGWQVCYPKQALRNAFQNIYTDCPNHWYK